MKEKSKLKKVYEIDVPSEVLWFRIQAGYGLGVSVGEYQKMIEKYPEHFKEEVKYQETWKNIPQEVKDAYDKEVWRPLWETEFEDLGEIPYPELVGGGIIQRVAHHMTPQYHEIEAKYRANEAWQAEVSKIRHKREIEAYNKHFKAYGLQKPSTTDSK